MLVCESKSTLRLVCFQAHISTLCVSFMPLHACTGKKGSAGFTGRTPTPTPPPQQPSTASLPAAPITRAPAVAVPSSAIAAAAATLAAASYSDGDDWEAETAAIIALACQTSTSQAQGSSEVVSRFGFNTPSPDDLILAAKRGHLIGGE